jgi:hypothetical protein
VNSINPMVTVVVSVISSGGVWTFLQFIMGRRNEAARLEAEKEKQEDEQEKRKVERSTLLAAAQQTAQTTALDSVGKANRVLEKQCNDCLGRLREMERRDQRRDRIEDAMLDAMVEVVPLLPADGEQTAALRAAIRTARQARYELDGE